MSEFSPYAAQEHTSKGRMFAESNPVYRNQYQRDRDRIIHTAAFRRLEYKTQVFVNHEGDMFRNRLTHSLEVSQIGRTIARVLKVNEDLTEAICLAHDLGHTPFGHAGQDALNACMREYGGFEHNLQSLRVVDKLEERYPEFPGLNLMFESREGILKHCSRKNAEELGELGERFLQGRQPGLEAQIANIADEIAYNNHDVDDGLRAGLITITQLAECKIFNEQLEQVKSRWPDISEKRQVAEVVRRMINHVVTDLVNTSTSLINEFNPQTIDDVRAQKNPLIQFSRGVHEDHLQLKRFLRKNLYQHDRVRQMTQKADEVINQLFNAYMKDLSRLPEDFQQRIDAESGPTADQHAARVIADYIAGMTDRYAFAEFEKLNG